MNTDWNLIANQVNSPLPGRLRPLFESASSATVLPTYDSIANRRAQSPTIPIRSNEPANLTIQSNWPLPEIKPVDELNEDIIKTIGENGLQRFEQFKKYNEGWDLGGIGKPLSSHSVATFKLFCKQLTGTLPDEPSLFLTHEGNLQLGWEDKEGNKIEIEFFPNKIEYYIEVLDDEGEVDLTHISQLIDTLKSVVE